MIIKGTIILLERKLHLINIQLPKLDVSALFLQIIFLVRVEIHDLSFEPKVLIHISGYLLISKIKDIGVQ